MWITLYLQLWNIVLDIRLGFNAIIVDYIITNAILTYIMIKRVYSLVDHRQLHAIQ